MLNIPELDQQILLHLDFFTLWQAREVNTYLKTLCTSAHFWKEKLWQDYAIKSNHAFSDYCMQMAAQALNECQLTKLYFIRSFIDYYRLRIKVNGCSKMLKEILPNKIVVAGPKLMWAETVLVIIGNHWYTYAYNTQIRLHASVQ